jgi:hypothetical protein
MDSLALGRAWLGIWEISIYLSFLQGHKGQPGLSGLPGPKGEKVCVCAGILILKLTFNL